MLHFTAGGIEPPVEYEGGYREVDSVDAAVSAAFDLAKLEPAVVRNLNKLTSTVPGMSLFPPMLAHGMAGLAGGAGAARLSRLLQLQDGRQAPLPEVLFEHPTEGTLVVAEGAGILRDITTGQVLYQGLWRHGMRHGKGRSSIFECESKKNGSCMRFLYLGEYTGDHYAGLRHGVGVLVEEEGDKYDGQWVGDMRHGTGAEYSLGGGVFKGTYWRDRRHGCGTFQWPAGGRTEHREYNHGAVVASYPHGESESQAGARAAGGPTGSVLSLPVTLAQGAAMARPASLHQLAEHAASLVAAAGGAVGAGGSGEDRSPSAVPGYHRHVVGLSSSSADGADAGLPLDGALGAAAGAGGAGAATTLVTIPLPLSFGAGGAAAAARPPYASAVQHFLKHSSISDVPGGRSGGGSIVTVKLTDNVETCITRMTENNVLSVPVFSEGEGKYVAILHLLDICAFMLDLVSKKKATFSPAHASLRETLAHQRRFATASVSEVLEMSSHIAPTTFTPLPSGAPLIYAARVLATGAHAVPVMDSAGTGVITRMLTQADVIRYLASHLDELGSLAGMTMGELGLKGNGESMVIARFTDKAIDVFSEMRAKQAHAAPVVDSYGSMAANLSFSDIKAIARRANFSALQLSVQQFFQAIEKGSEVRGQGALLRCAESAAPPTARIHHPFPIHFPLSPSADHVPQYLHQAQHAAGVGAADPGRNQDPPAVLLRQRDIAPHRHRADHGSA